MRINGSAVKERREELLLERSELAKLLGISYSTVYKMEAHDHVPRLSTVKAVAKALKLDPKKLVFRERREPEEPEREKADGTAA